MRHGGARDARYRARRGQQRGDTGYADCGCDGDMGTTAQTPAEAAKQAVEAAGHKTLIPQGSEEGKKLGRPDIMETADVAAIFGPGTPRGHYPHTCSKKYILEVSTRVCAALPKN